jgi:hypothetical protein
LIGWLQLPLTDSIFMPDRPEVCTVKFSDSRPFSDKSAKLFLGQSFLYDLTAPISVSSLLLQTLEFAITDSLSFSLHLPQSLKFPLQIPCPFLANFLDL